MPKITLISAAAAVEIPRLIQNNIASRRSSLVISLISGDAYWGFKNESVKTLSAAGATDAGIPMAVGSPVILVSDDRQYSNPILLFSPGGGVINYQEGVL